MAATTKGEKISSACDGWSVGWVGASGFLLKMELINPFTPD